MGIGASYPFGGITEQRKAALRRREDAHVLRSARRWRGAMYLLGYAVECSLKARLMECFNVRTLSGLERKLGERIGQEVNLRTHSLQLLFEFTSAEHRLNGDGSQRRAFYRCRAWNINWRYDPYGGDEVECTDFFEACNSFLRFVDTSV